MRLLVIGVGGQGEASILQALKDPSLSKLKIADINEERIKHLTVKLNNKKIEPTRLDAAHYDEVSNSIEGMDVVINAIGAAGNPDLTHNVFNAALKMGTHYIDVATGGNKNMMNEQDKAWKDRNLTAIYSLGKTPGITNLLAKYASTQLDTVDTIRVLSTLDVISDEFLLMWYPLWNVMGFDPKTEKTQVYEDGEWKKVPALSGEEIYEFPGDTQGPVTLYLSNHGEVQTLPRYIQGVKYVEFKHGQHIFPALKVLAELFGSRKPITVKGVQVVPADVMEAVIPPVSILPEKIASGIVKDAYSCCVVEVKGKKRGVETKYTLSSPMDQKACQSHLPGSQPESIMVGTPSVIAASMLVEGKIKERGVMSPEALDAQPILRRLITDVGIEIREKVETTWK